MKKSLPIILLTLFWYTTNPSVISIDPATGKWRYIAPGETQVCVQYLEITQCIDGSFK